ncbi:MAG: hypothetical protein IH598_07145 [Bacteroidales bacterium]|nr:hypothetical protein [Bacteroidales bacterium]
MRIFLSLLIFLNTTLTFAQDSVGNTRYPASSIIFKYGLGSYALKDHYISDGKYTGTMSCLSFGWVRNHSKYVYQLDLEYRSSDEIRNYNVSARITQFTLNQGFLYQLKKGKLFNQNVDLFLGPTTEFFYFYNEPHIAVDGFDYAQSFAGLFSAGIEGAAKHQAGSRFLIESSLRLSLLSLAFRMVDSEENDQSPVKLVTLFSGVNASFNAGVRYHVFQTLSISAGYRFELCRIGPWEPLISASNNLLIGLSLDF